MKLIGAIRRAIGGHRSSGRREIVASSFDVARTTPRNARQWIGAYELAADAAANADSRRLLRNRSRYVDANVSVANGMLTTLADDIVGTGPRVQVTDTRFSDDERQQIERAWVRWLRAVGYGETLSLAVRSGAASGESFQILALNPMLTGSEVDLDPRLVEADRVTAPYGVSMSEDSAGIEVDGIRFDSFGNPLSYFVLRDHPGAENTVGNFFDGDEVDAARVIHYFRPLRPGMSRGVPWLTPSLDRFLNLALFLQATLDAARTAANVSGVLKSDFTPADTDDAAEPDESDIVEMAPGEWMTLPAGWSMQQFKAEHPQTTLPQFRREVIADGARCLGMPYNIAAGDSSGYNYASGRLDHQTYFKSIKVHRARIERMVLARVFRAWLARAVLVEGALPQSLRSRGADFSFDIAWHWDGSEHVDPQKEAAAQAIKLDNMTTTLADEYGRQGRDWREAAKQLSEEKKLLAELGLSGAEAASPVAREPAGVTDDNEGGGE